MFTCIVIKTYHKYHGISTPSPGKPNHLQLRKPSKGPRCLFEGPRLIDCPVPERHLHFQTPCLIQRNLSPRSLSVNLQRAGFLEVSSARQELLPRPQPVGCSDRVPILLHPRQQIRSATRAQPEEVLSLVVEEVGLEMAAIHSVEEQISRRVDLVGALARCRATILLLDFLALDRQDNRTIHL